MAVQITKQMDEDIKSGKLVVKKIKSSSKFFKYVHIVGPADEIAKLENNDTDMAN